MSISWAITDKRYERQPWERENFDGYFTDIRRAARKSLPRKPNKDLCGILGLQLPSQRSLPPGNGIKRQSIADELPNASTSLKPIALQAVDRQTEVEQQSGSGGSSTLKSILLCNTSGTDNCSQREKTIIGFSVYFAIIIFVLLIIVLVLSTTLSRSDENNDKSNEAVRSLSSSTLESTASGPTPRSKLLTSTSKIKTNIDPIITQSASQIPFLTTITSKESPETTLSKIDTIVTRLTPILSTSNIHKLSKETVLTSEGNTQSNAKTTTQSSSSSVRSRSSTSTSSKNTHEITKSPIFLTPSSSETSSGTNSLSNVSDTERHISKSTLFATLTELSSSKRPTSSSVSSVSDSAHQITKGTVLSSLTSSRNPSVLKSSIGSSVSDNTHQITKSTVLSSFTTSKNPSIPTSSNGPFVSDSTHQVTKSTILSTFSNSGSSNFGSTSGTKSTHITSVSNSTNEVTTGKLFSKSKSSPTSGSNSPDTLTLSGSTEQKTKSTLSSTLSSSGYSSGMKSSIGSNSSEITKSTLFSSPSTVSVSTNTEINSTGNTSLDQTLSPTTSHIPVNPDSFPFLSKDTVRCTSNACFAANKTLQRVDFERSPCVDFYKFACGSWIRQQKNKKRQGENNVPMSLQAELRQNLILDIKDLLKLPYRDDESFSARVSRRLYKSCLESNSQITLESEEIQELHNFIDLFGLTFDADTPLSVEEMLQIAVTMFEVSPFFKISTVPTFNENGNYVMALKVEPTHEYLQFKIYNSTVNKGEESYAYVERLTTLLHSYITTKTRRRRQASGGSSGTMIEYGELFEKVRRVYYIESNISKILENTETTIDLQYITYQYTYAKLKTEYPSFKWDAAIETLGDNIPVQMINADYFQALDTLWKDLDEDDVKLFVFMSVLRKRVLKYARQPFRTVLSNVGDSGDTIYTEIDCAELSLDLASEEIHALYIGQFTQTVLANRLKLTDIKNKINSAFQKLLSSSTLVKQGLNIAASTMAKNIKMNFSPLKTSVRQTTNITGEKQTFMSLALELHKQKYMYEMSRVGKPVSEISMDWTNTQVYFDAHLNAIGLPTGLAIYLNAEDQPFEIYSYLGMLIAEKFVRVLTGPLIGGIPLQWWGTENILSFTEAPRCFGQQLSQFQNNYYDIGNIMISNSAFEITKQVYETYSSNLERVIPGTSIKENMLFSINTAQLHCEVKGETHIFRLIKERMNNVIMNNVDLKQMFSCPDFSPLVSNNTCTLFS